MAITEDAPPNAYFVTDCCTLDNGLEEQIRNADSDPFNMLSGSNGLAGGVDTMFVLAKSSRCSGNATRIH